MIDIEALHHVSLPVTDLEWSKEFDRDILGLPEIERPDFDFPGAWSGMDVGDGQLHLIVHDKPTTHEGNRFSRRPLRRPGQELPPYRGIPEVQGLPQRCSGRHEEAERESHGERMAKVSHLKPSLPQKCPSPSSTRSRD